MNQHTITPPLTTPEAANYLSVQPTTLEVWRVQGRGPRFLKLGRAVRYRQSDLDAYLSAGSRQSTSDRGEG